MSFRGRVIDAACHDVLGGQIIFKKQKFVQKLQKFVQKIAKLRSKIGQRESDRIMPWPDRDFQVTPWRPLFYRSV